MVNDILVAILVNKIRSGEINPNTNEAFKVDDIKSDEYKSAVETKLNTTS
ncbi:hypothetical protein [Clostridium sp. BL-8]|nr:hypothetical protein [Clostridium sp. BL-8]OOM76567.1 hypothetical protein CLOBL_34520 [Clostridium sp. BL-8]